MIDMFSACTIAVAGQDAEDGGLVLGVGHVELVGADAALARHPRQLLDLLAGADHRAEGGIDQRALLDRPPGPGEVVEERDRGVLAVEQRGDHGGDAADGGVAGLGLDVDVERVLEGLKVHVRVDDPGEHVQPVRLDHAVGGADGPGRADGCDPAAAGGDVGLHDAIREDHPATSDHQGPAQENPPLSGWVISARFPVPCGGSELPPRPPKSACAMGAAAPTGQAASLTSSSALRSPSASSASSSLVITSGGETWIAPVASDRVITPAERAAATARVVRDASSAIAAGWICTAASTPSATRTSLMRSWDSSGRSAAASSSSSDLERSRRPSRSMMSRLARAAAATVACPE